LPISQQGVVTGTYYQQQQKNLYLSLFHVHLLIFSRIEKSKVLLHFRANLLYIRRELNMVYCTDVVILYMQYVFNLSRKKSLSTMGMQEY
jgi:hypothetical protein